MSSECPFIVDLGTFSVKAGLADSQTPTLFSNITGRVKYTPVLPNQNVEGLIDNSLFISNDVKPHRGILNISYPMEHGNIVDWNGISRIFNHVYSSLDVNAKTSPLLLTEAVQTSRIQRSRLGELVFEQLQHPELLFAVQPLLSLYALGNTTGIVLDIGEGVTQTCPMYKGYTIQGASRRVEFGGRDVTRYLQGTLRDSGIYLDCTSAEFEIVREIKEQQCSVSPVSRGVGSDDEKLNLTKKQHHCLPDGTELRLDKDTILSPEVLFNPSLMGSDSMDVSQVLQESILRADIDLRRHLYENIVLAGGTTLCDNFCGRFLTEMTKRIPRDCKVKLTAPYERVTTTWTGASLISQLSSFKQMVVDKKQYMEEGDRILHSKVLS